MADNMEYVKQVPLLTWNVSVLNGYKERVLGRMYLMISHDKIAFRTDLKLILNMDSSIDKDSIKGETNVLTKKRIVGQGIDQINLEMQMESTKLQKDTENEKVKNMIGDQAFVPPTIIISSNMPIKHNDMTIYDQVDQYNASNNIPDNKRSERNAKIMAMTQNLPEKQEPSSDMPISWTTVDEDEVFMDIDEEEVRTLDTATTVHPSKGGAGFIRGALR